MPIKSEIFREQIEIVCLTDYFSKSQVAFLYVSCILSICHAFTNYLTDQNYK